MKAAARFAPIFSVPASALALVMCVGACNSDDGSRTDTGTPNDSDAATDSLASETAEATETEVAETEVAQPPAPFTLAADGVTVAIQTAPFGMTVKNAAGRVVLQTIDADPAIAGDTVKAYGALGATDHTVEITAPIIEGYDHALGTDGPWHHGTHVVAATLTDATHASLELAESADGPAILRVDLSVQAAELVVDAHVVEAGLGLNQVGQAFVLGADEHVFGLGERYISEDHRGRHYTCWTEEGGVPLGETIPAGDENPFPNGPNMTHLPVPFFMSTGGYGLWIESTFRTGFALGSDADNALRLYAEEPRLRYHVFVGDDLRGLMKDFTAQTGRAHLPAPWVFGPRRRSNLIETVDGVLETDLLRQRKVPTTAIDDARHFLPIASHKGSEDALRAWTAKMHAQGYKAIGYYNAYVSVTSARTTDWTAEAREKGYFVKLADGSEFDTPMVSSGPQTVATIDMSNPEAVVWYQARLQEALDLGYDGWMLDFGEYLPPDAKLFDGRSGFEAHNDFPIMYQKATFDYMTRVRGNDFMYFARAGYTGTQALTPVVWSGDPASSFDDNKGLPAQVRGGINAGLSGIPFWGSDISGYTCVSDPPADKEVYLRWAEFGAFSSDMHDENACANAPANAPPKWTLWSDEETTRVYGDYARVHTRLFPYLYAAAKEATENGMPVMRHPVFEHPKSAGAYQSEFDYYFGPSLYVAPVVRRGATTRELWLPPGQWVDFWTYEPIVGDRVVTRAAPLGVIPVFLKSGAVVAMLDASVETLASDTREDVISLDDVAGIYDVRAAIDRATQTGSATLVDGTGFDMTLSSGAVVLPGDVAVASDEADLATCARCGRIDTVAGGAHRVRLSLAPTTSADVAVGGLRLMHHAPNATRVRWDVIVVDP